jgi:hypothetical protein
VGFRKQSAFKERFLLKNPAVTAVGGGFFG